MLPFQLKHERAYVVSALRHKSHSTTHSSKVLRLVVLAVLVVHLAVISGLLHTRSEPIAELTPASSMETVVILDLESEPESVKPLSPAIESKQNPVENTEVKQVVQALPTPTPQLKPVAQASMPVPEANAPIKHASEPVAVSESIKVPAPTPAQSAVASASSASERTPTKACNQIVAINKRFGGMLQSDQRVTVRIERTASGSVRSVDLISGSGNAVLDEFAVSNARRARFERNSDCEGRVFPLSILFKAKG